MAKKNRKSKTISGATETINWFDESFESSGANSQGEFLQRLLENWNQDEPAPKVETQTVTIEKELEQNQLLFNLSPAQAFAIRGNVSSPGFAQKQNSLIDSLKGGSPFMYFGNLYDPAFQKLWVKNIVITKEMSEPEKEGAIKCNMSAFLVNMYLMHAIEGDVSASNINAASIKEFIGKEASKLKQLQTQKDNGNS